MQRLLNKEVLEKYTQKIELKKIFDSDIFDFVELHCFEKGEVILEAGSRIEYYYLIVEGEVKIAYPYENGKSVLLKLYRPFNCFGDIELLKDIRIVANVEAIKKSKILAIPVEIIRKKYLFNVNFLRHLTFTYSNKLHAIISNASYNVAYPLSNRVASYLLNNADNGIINVEHSYQEIAEFLGTTYRHLNRVFKELEEKNLISINTKKIKILNSETLNELAKGDYLEYL